MRHSLRIRLLVVLILVVVVVAGTIALVSTQVTTRTFRGYEDRRVVMRDRRFKGFLGLHYARHGDWSGAQLEVERMGQVTGGRVVLADAEGWIVADSERELTAQPVGWVWGAPAGQIVHDGLPVGALYVGVPRSSGMLSVEGFLILANRALLTIAVGCGLGAILLILGFSRRVFAPIEALTAAARRMEAGET